MIGYKLGNKHWCRIVMDQETDKLIRGLPVHELNVLEISGQKWKDFGFKSYKNVTYPEFDICQQVLDEKFDLIIAEQVFEHILWPYKAAKNVYAMLKDGGNFLITTPFLLRIHVMPYDCSRWSATGMKYLLAEAGFDPEKVIADSWGNKDCLIANLKEWMPYNPGHHSLKNDPIFPLVVWALAKK